MAIDDASKTPAKAAAAPATASVAAKSTDQDSGEEPIIIDLGKKNRKQVRKLRKGKPCRLLSRVEETIEQIRSNPEFGGGQRPIVVVVRQRQGRKGRRAAKMWGLG